MKTLLLILLVCCIGTTNAQIKIYETFNELEKELLLPKDNDTLYILNFWATWCIPCVKELPFFEAINLKYANEKVKIVLVSLDFPENIESRLIPFIAKKNIKSQVVLLADGKAYDLIDKVDPSWSGSIPITLFLKGKQKVFYEKEYHNIHELETDINQLKNI